MIASHADYSKTNVVFPIKQPTYKMKKKAKEKVAMNNFQHRKNLLTARPTPEMVPPRSNNIISKISFPGDTFQVSIPERTGSDLLCNNKSACSVHFQRYMSTFAFMLAVGLSLVLILSNPTGVNGDLVGGVIAVPLVLDRVDTPYYIRDDVIVAETGELIIRPGVQMLFSPTVGITVFGRLIAEVIKLFL